MVWPSRFSLPPEVCLLNIRLVPSPIPISIWPKRVMTYWTRGALCQLLRLPTANRRYVISAPGCRSTVSVSPAGTFRSSKWAWPSFPVDKRTILLPPGFHVVKLPLFDLRPALEWGPDCRPRLHNAADDADITRLLDGRTNLGFRPASNAQVTKAWRTAAADSRSYHLVEPRLTLRVFSG